MTEISTNEVNSVNHDLKLAEEDCCDDLDGQDQQFYSYLSSRLNRIQISPKVETILKIIAYSRKYKKI